MSGIDVSRFVSTKSPVERAEAAPLFDDKGCRSSDAIGYCRIDWILRARWLKDQHKL